MENRSTPLFKQLYPQYGWEIDSLKDPEIRRREWMLGKTRKRKYPARLLRYWFVYHFLRDLGCEWYFPGKVGEVVPELQNIQLPKTQRIQ